MSRIRYSAEVKQQAIRLHSPIALGELLAAITTC